MLNQEISEFGIFLLFLGAGVFFVVAGFVTAWLIRPNRPNIEKITPYECGEEAIGNAWGQFNIRYYLIALVFLLFEVEIIFLFPWATIFGQQELLQITNFQWGWFVLIEAFIFVGILLIGLIYAWIKGYLDWVKPEVKVPEFQSPIPESFYQKINQHHYKHTNTVIKE